MNSLNRNNDQHLVLYFQVHQPRRLNPVNFFDIANQPLYFDDRMNAAIVRRIASNCYLPANKLLLDLIERYPGIRINLSLSGVVIEQLEAYAPEALESFRQLAQTGSVEFLAETYYHSLASLSNGDEFEVQVLQHAEKLMELFGVRPSVFRNTELIYNNAIGQRVAAMGYNAIFTEGHEKILGNRTPGLLYRHPELDHFRILLRNYRLSDDIAFRFSSGLTVDQYLSWLHAVPSSETLVSLAMDYETFGEHHGADSGILDFLRGLLTSLAQDGRFIMRSASEAVRETASEILSVDTDLSWADQERDLSAWLGNDMQKDAFNSLMKLENEVKSSGDTSLLKSWRYLQTSDHFYYMSLKTDSDGSVHSYFSPFRSSYEAFINFMNVVTHLTCQLRSNHNTGRTSGYDLSGQEAERQETKATTPVWVMNLESVPQGNVPEEHR